MFVTTGAVKKIRSKRKKSFYDKYVVPLLTEASNLDISIDEIQAQRALAAAENKELSITKSVMSVQEILQDVKYNLSFHQVAEDKNIEIDPKCIDQNIYSLGCSSRIDTIHYCQLIR